MSTVDVTDLPEGTAAVAADVNATLTSWNSGSAAISETNVRVEGVDRGVMSGSTHLVMTEEVGENTIVAVTNVTGTTWRSAWAVVTGMETIDYTVASTSNLMLRCSVFVSSPHVDTGIARLIVELYLQQSSNGGGVWTDIAGTYRELQMKDVGATYTGDGLAIRVTPGIKQSVTWCKGLPASGSAIRYRLVARTTNDGSIVGGVDPTFVNGVLYIETYGS